MEVVLLASALNTLFPRIWDKRNEAKEREWAINNNIEAIGRESKRLEAALEDAKFKGVGTGSAEVPALKREARELSQYTRDCIQRFFKNDKADSKKFAMDIQAYKKRIENLCDRLEKLPSGETASSEKPQDRLVDVVVGLDGPLADLLELRGSRPSDGRRKVTSIVGFPGLGKTLLAKLVYDNDRTRTTLVQESSRTNTPPDHGTLRARITAAAKKPQEILREILKQVGTEANDENLQLDELAQLLADRLREKSYFIVIDDMQSTEQWNAMNDAFPKDGHEEGTIIVTTTIQSVANVCSSCNGYVYKLSPLDQDESLDLFLKDRPLWDRGLAKNYASDVLKKCDGLPLAIVSVSQILEGRGLTRGTCEAVFRGLDADDLEEESRDLQRLQWVLMNKYTGLTGYALRSCLLYFCMYKHDMDADAVPRKIPSKNSMIRRWEAEGFLVERNGRRRATDVGAENLETLVDRNIIQSMEIGTNGATRRCRPPGMMFEYISQISKSENFAALVSDVEEPKGIRRLYFHDGNAGDDRKMSEMDLSIVLTMAVSGKGCDAILNFKKYELIAVLDLKECTNLEHRHVKYICKLLLLKYLSLGKTIGKIPRAIGNLELLETLEMRTTETVKVYREVLELPNLKHLLGNFLLRTKPGRSLYNFLKKESGLETITGFVTKTAKGFPKLMCHMGQLRKVKIYCTPNASESDVKELRTAIKAFTAKGMNMADKNRSLSIEFAAAGPEGLASPLEFLEDQGSVDSLKLVGEWTPFLNSKRRTIPEFTNISGITKLCLSRTYLRGNYILAGLTSLSALVYLKLDEQVLGPLEIKPDTFQSLKRLCLLGETSLHGITIHHGALPSLESLHLICKDLQDGPESSIVSRNVKSLKEIALHSEVGTSIKDAWKEAAKDHPNRPGVLFI